MSNVKLKVKRQKLKVGSKRIKNRLPRGCSICGREIEIVLYTNKTYRGGYYFFDVPLCTKKECEKARRAGTRTEMLDGRAIQVMRRDPKPYAYLEYWECPKCFRTGKDSDPPKPVLTDKKNIVKMLNLNGYE